jgi:hypothetical protein
MKQRRQTPEQIIRKLRDTDRLLRRVRGKRKARGRWASGSVPTGQARLQPPPASTGPGRSSGGADIGHLVLLGRIRSPSLGGRVISWRRPQPSQASGHRRWEAVMRRVVTGQRPDGRSAVVSDGPAPQSVVVGRMGGATFETLWQLAIPPASPTGGGDPTRPSRFTAPNPGKPAQVA